MAKEEKTLDEMFQELDKLIQAMEEPEESLEELFAKLDQVAKELESGDTSLEESFGLYQKGMEMLKLCNEKIDTVEKKVQVLEENGEIHDF